MPVLMKPGDFYSYTKSNSVHLPEVLTISLASLSSFSHWQTVLAERIRYQSILHGIPDGATSHLLGLVRDASSIYRISGHADIYVHKWPNGETKTVPVWGSQYILQTDMQWIPSYPFLVAAEHDLSRKVFRIKDGHFQCLASKRADVAYLIASHNNHFGHFLLDNMPALMLMGSLGCLDIKGELSTPVRYKEGISEFLSAIPGELGDQIDDTAIIGSYCIRSTRATEIIGSSIYTNAYLWKMLAKRVKRYLVNTSTSLFGSCWQLL